MDLFAAYVSILSAAAGGGSTTKSETSMSAPHVAGAAALALSGNEPPGSIGALSGPVSSTATEGVVVAGRSGDGDLLLYTVLLAGDGHGSDPEPEPDPELSDIALSVAADIVQGWQKADLDWSGATSTSVDLHRDGTVVARVRNCGSSTGHINKRGGGSDTYRVCEAGTATCSEEVTARCEPASCPGLGPCCPPASGRSEPRRRDRAERC